MNTSVMKCPKCGYPRDGGEQCPSCGIVFSKYAEKRRRLEELEYERLAQKEENRRRLFKKLGAAIVVACVSVVVVVNFDSEAPASQQGTSSSRQLTNPYSQNSSKKLLDDNVKGQVAHATFKVRNSRISYPKDSSTSFLITRSCYALTDSYISKMPSSSGSVNSRLDSVDQRIANLSAQLEERRQDFIKTCSDCSNEAFEKVTKRIQSNIESAVKEQERLHHQIPASTGRAETLSANFNSNSYSLDIVERNEGLGVSLLRINSNTACEPVTIGDSHSLKPGDEIFMMGASGRVADGVVTGFTTTNSGYGLITHTASAASIGGLLGTPLFNKKGEVLGINVNGIGNERYALRIEEVLEEFGIVP